MCVYVYMRVYTYTCMYTHMCIYIYTCIYIYVYTHVCVYIYVCVCIHTRIEHVYVNTAVNHGLTESPLRRCAQQDGISQAAGLTSSGLPSHPARPSAPVLRRRPRPHEPAQQVSMPARPHAARAEAACLALFKAGFGSGLGGGPAAARRHPSSGAGPGGSVPAPAPPSDAFGQSCGGTSPSQPRGPHRSPRCYIPVPPPPPAALQRGRRRRPVYLTVFLKNPPSPKPSLLLNQGTGVNALPQPLLKVNLASISSVLHLPEHVPVPTLGCHSLARCSPGSCRGTRR